jgi:hypothetical protein
MHRNSTLDFRPWTRPYWQPQVPVVPVLPQQSAFASWAQQVSWVACQQQLLSSAGLVARTMRPCMPGNKRLGWSAAAVFCDLNGFDLVPPSTQAAVELVLQIASGAEPDLSTIAGALANWMEPDR